MAEHNVYEVIIIGGGPAGISAGIWCSRLGIRALILEQNQEIGGQLQQIFNPIIDYPGLIVQNGQQLQQKLEEHLQQVSIAVLTDHKVQRIEYNNNFEYIVVTNQGLYYSRYLILATGSVARKLHIPGEELIAHEGNYSSQKNIDVFCGKRVLIVGGGDRALEGALSIAKVAREVSIVHRQDRFRARDEFVQALSQYENIQIYTPYVVKKIETNNRLKVVTLAHVHTQETMFNEYDLVLIRIGREPVDDYLSFKLQKNENGWIQVDDNGRTSIDSIFAIGDLITSPSYSSIVQAVGQGMRAVKTIYEDMHKKKE